MEETKTLVEQSRAGDLAAFGRLATSGDSQKVHVKLPKWVTTRLYVGYHSGEDVLRMGPIPWDRADGHHPDEPDLDNQGPPPKPT